MCELHVGGVQVGLLTRGGGHYRRSIRGAILDTCRATETLARPKESHDHH